MLSVMTAFTGLPLTAVVTEYSAVIEVLLLLYEVALHSKQALLSGVHCNAGDTAVWPGSMHCLQRSARYTFLVTLPVLKSA